MDDLSYEQYRELMHALNSRLSEFVSVEDAMMSCGITKAFDFGASSSRLIEIAKAVSEIRASILPFTNQQDGNYSINTALTYVDLFLESIQQLTVISTNLAKKANGIKYGFFAYRRDLNDYRKKEGVREAMGGQLNSAFSRSW